MIDERTARRLLVVGDPAYRDAFLYWLRFKDVRPELRAVGRDGRYPVPLSLDPTWRHLRRPKP